MRHQPVAGRQHLARDFRVASLVRIEQLAIPEQDEPGRDQRQQAGPQRRTDVGAHYIWCAHVVAESVTQWPCTASVPERPANLVQLDLMARQAVCLQTRVEIAHRYELDAVAPATP